MTPTKTPAEIVAYAKSVFDQCPLELSNKDRRIIRHVFARMALDSAKIMTGIIIDELPKAQKFKPSVDGDLYLESAKNIGYNEALDDVIAVLNKLKESV